MKRIFSIAVIIYLLFLWPSVAAAELPPVGAKAAIVIDATTGRILFAQSIDEKLPIASTTKIMTALLALEQPGRDRFFEVDDTAIKVEGSSMGLQLGDEVSLYSLAQGMLLASGNDAANAAAVRIAGSVDSFSEIMNVRATELGMTNTSFVTPSGLDADAHYSTARDMAMLAASALKNPDFAEICSQYRMQATFGNPPYERWLTNHNKLLSYYPYAIGVKTGFTKKAGRCLVSAAQRDGITLVCVTLNSPDDWNIHEQLYEKCFPMQQIIELSGTIPQIQIPITGSSIEFVKAVPYNIARLSVPAGGELEYRITAPKFLYAPVLSGQSLGQADVIYNGEILASFTLVSDRDALPLHPYENEKPGLWGWFLDLCGLD